MFTQNYTLPAEYRKLFLQCIFYLRQHPSAVSYLDVDTVELFGMIFSQLVLQLCQQEALASNHYQAKEPVYTTTVSLLEKIKFFTLAPRSQRIFLLICFI